MGTSSKRGCARIGQRIVPAFSGVSVDPHCYQSSLGPWRDWKSSQLHDLGPSSLSLSLGGPGILIRQMAESGDHSVCGPCEEGFGVEGGDPLLCHLVLSLS